MDTFKLCAENNYVVMIVPHNLTNKFLPLDLSVNMAANSFIQNKYNDWFADGETIYAAPKWKRSYRC